MPNNYPPEFRRQMVEVVRAGRTPEELAKEFQPSAQSIRTWVRQADLDDGRRQDGLTSAEKDELARLRRENKILREEKEILRKAAAFFARETDLPEMKFRLIHAEKDHHEVSLLARVLGVSRQGYYAWAARQRRGPSARARRDAELTEQIRAHHQASDEIYGAPRGMAPVTVGCETCQYCHASAIPLRRREWAPAVGAASFGEAASLTFLLRGAFGDSPVEPFERPKPG
ncbi:transposase [Nonomuraea zeae]|uniref:Transposase n=1 Tax=Nonomuraea zeae TaxID=1642303 RepID=A0A5S4GVJ8_9ACTN|nr:transposase [Nonomuraea zeae]TMR36978.1 hypothetical protein ETD85_09525 [Nonomuraea zeae]